MSSLRTAVPGFIAALLVCLSMTSLAMGQAAPDEEAAAACGACACGAVILVLVALFVVHILILVWVARDAKARNMDSGVLWIILILMTGVVGLIIYIFSRPQGNVVRCQHCGNKRLEASAQCPHCGNP